MKNGYTSATGTQDILNTPDDEAKAGGGARAPAPEPRAQEPHHRGHAEGHGRAVAARGAHLRGRRDAPHARGGAHQRVRRPQGDRRRGRVPARSGSAASSPGSPRCCSAASVSSASGTASTRTCAAATTPASACRLPDADDQGQPRSAQGRPGGHGDRRLRRLRPVRRQRPCGDAVPELLPRRGDPQPALARAAAGGLRSRLISLLQPA